LKLHEIPTTENPHPMKTIVTASWKWYISLQRFQLSSKCGFVELIVFIPCVMKPLIHALFRILHKKCMKPIFTGAFDLQNSKYWTEQYMIEHGRT
jgi:hypothetical protein